MDTGMTTEDQLASLVERLMAENAALKTELEDMRVGSSLHGEYCEADDRQKAMMETIAALKARLALAEKVVEAARVIMTPMPKEVHTDDRRYNDEVCRRGAVMRGALAIYDAHAEKL